MSQETYEGLATNRRFPDLSFLLADPYILVFVSGWKPLAAERDLQQQI